MNINEYSFKELAAAATMYNATQEEINALGDWFRLYGQDYWNGESYVVDEKNDLRLYPMHKQVSEDDFEIVGYSFSASAIFVE